MGNNNLLGWGFLLKRLAQLFLSSTVWKGSCVETYVCL